MFSARTSDGINTLIHYFKAVTPWTFPYTEHVSRNVYLVDVLVSYYSSFCFESKFRSRRYVQVIGLSYLHFFLWMEDGVVVSQYTILSATIISKLFLSNCVTSLSLPGMIPHWTINLLSLGTIFNWLLNIYCPAMAGI